MNKGSLDPPVMPGVTKVAAAPVSMAARLKAKACGPRYELPDELKTFIAR
jgi:hypothetical protein